jgi:hypothetical protein
VGTSPPSWSPPRPILDRGRSPFGRTNFPFIGRRKSRCTCAPRIVRQCAMDPAQWHDPRAAVNRVLAVNVITECVKQNSAVSPRDRTRESSQARSRAPADRCCFAPNCGSPRHSVLASATDARSSCAAAESRFSTNESTARRRIGCSLTTPSRPTSNVSRASTETPAFARVREWGATPLAWRGAVGGDQADEAGRAALAA